MDLDEGVCASCGKPLGPRANWRLAESGRAYHNDCEPKEVDEEPEKLGAFAERKARQAMRGRGQQILEEPNE